LTFVDWQVLTVRISAERYISQTKTTRRPTIVWSLVLFGSMLFVLAILAAPIATANGNSSTAFTIYRAFHTLCHQQPERSFFIAGHPFAVCARCTGIYFGFALAALAYPLLGSLRRTDTPARTWLFLAALPLGVDVGINFFGIWQNTHTSRLLTGALLGATAVFYVMPGLVDVALNHFGSRRRVRSAVEITNPHLAAGPSDYSSPQRRI
jgi:uncharacterized membrane protein